jgi:hypothetical protein
VGGYINGGGQHIVPSPPSYSPHQLQPLAQWTGPMATPVSASTTLVTGTSFTTTGGSTPRRTLTDDDRRRMCEYHESHPGVKQTEIGGMSVLDHSYAPS